MKKLLLFLAFVFVMQKSFGQSCGSVVLGGPTLNFCGPGCQGNIFIGSSFGTPPYGLTINSLFFANYNAGISIQGFCAGVDTFIVTDSTFSCTDTLIVTFVEVPPPSITLVVTNETCLSCCDGVITPDAPTAFSFLWSNTSASVIDSNLCSGIYTLTVTDHDGCVNSASATVAVGNCSAYFTMHPTGNPHDYWVVNSSTGAAPLSYDWDWGDGSPHDFIAFPTHTYATAGIYNITLTITDNVGCTNMQVYNSYLARMQQILTVTVVPSLPSGTEELSLENISLSPNPATTEIVVESEEFNVERIEMYSVVGERVKVLPLNPLKETSVSIDVSMLTPGIYFVALTDEKGNRAVRKVVKM